MGNAVDSGQSSSNSNELERKLKEQSDALWKIKDELKKHVAVAELREMLEANDQDSAGSEYDLRDRWYWFFAVLSSFFLSGDKVPFIVSSFVHEHKKVQQ